MESLFLAMICLSNDSASFNDSEEDSFNRFTPLHILDEAFSQNHSQEQIFLWSFFGVAPICKTKFQFLGIIQLVK